MTRSAHGATLPVVHALDDGAQRAALAQRATRARAETREGRAEWFHVGPVRTAARAEVVGDAPPPDPAPGDPATEGEGADAAAVPTADVYVFDTIGGWWGMTADDFVRDVAGLDVDRIVLHLNTPGGDVWEATAMASVLRQHRAEVIVRVDGVAASAGTILMMAGDEVIMSPGAMAMVHDAWSVSMGNAADMRKGADMLDAISDAIADTYAQRAGGTAAEWRAVMVEERWYTADQAVAAGLADRKATTAEDNATATGQQVVPGQSASSSWWDAWDSLGDPERHTSALAALYGGPRAQAPTPKPPTASAAGSTTARGGASVELPDEQVAQMRTHLGLPETADGGAIMAALTERLTAPPTAVLPDGIVPIEAGALAALQADASAGRAARDQQQAEERERFVQAAIDDGRIAPAARASFLAQLTPIGDGAVAQTVRAMLNGLPKGAIPTDGPRGYTGSTGGEPVVENMDTVRADPAYLAWKATL